MSDPTQTNAAPGENELQLAAKKAYLLYEQLRDMRANVRHKRPYHKEIFEKWQIHVQL